MSVVAYEQQIDYSYDTDGSRFPRLDFQMAKAGKPDVTVDVDAHLESGTERSLFNGKLATCSAACARWPARDPTR